MILASSQSLSPSQIFIKPRCSYFGVCGGCAYQDLPYETELALKERELRALFKEYLETPEDLFEPIVASPKPYHYRHRLDLKIFRTKSKDIFMGFTQRDSRRVIPVESCAIAMKSISDYLPRLKRAASLCLPDHYREASLVIRTGEDGEVLWGGIGRGSLKLEEAQYFWARLDGKKIYFSMDTFFQANLSILPLLMNRLRSLSFWNSNKVLLDLYGGVGVFAVSLADKIKQVILVEENIHSLKCARYNKKVHHIHNLLDLDAEANIAAWFSSIQLFTIGLLALTLSSQTNRPQVPSSKLLLIVSLLFIFFSADEAAEIHNKLGWALKSLTFIPQQEEGRGIWMVLYLSAGLIFFLYLRRDLLATLRQYRKPCSFIILGGILILMGVTALELIAYQLTDKTAEVTVFSTHPLYLLEVVGEELCEMIGASLILYGLLLITILQGEQNPS